MLTISTIKNKGGAAKYYSQEDNYYLSEVDAKDSSLWIGDGATRLGIKGKVEEEALHNLLNGKLPNGRIIGLKKDGTINHRAGYDLCFQAPKSVSILALDGEDKRFYNAHLEAIKETLKIIERDSAQARVYKDGQVAFENTKNLTIALIAHTTSRKLDLHLHHHSLVMNFTQRQDNAWRALASSKVRSDQVNGFFERIHKNQIYYGLIYKTSLANKMIQLGHEIEIVGPHGMWEIKGVPKEARDIMSKRRQEIEKKIKDLNYRSLKAADIVTLNTREKKPNNINLNEIKQSWKNELASVGFSSKDYIAEMDKIAERAEINKSKALSNESNIDLSNVDSQNNNGVTANTIVTSLTGAKEAVADAIEHLSQYSLKLDYTKIAALALEFSVGNTTHKDIIHALDETIQNKSLIPLDKQDSLFVTKNLIETEKTMMDFVDKSKGSGYPIEPKNKIIEDVIADREIKGKALKILQSKDRFHLIEHITRDNSDFVSCILKYAESSGKTVRVLSPNRMLTNDINENIKRKPNSLWQWLVSLGKPEVGDCIAGFIHKYQEEINAPFLKLRQGKDVLIINNAETLGSNDTKSLMELTAKTNARIIFLRDISIRQGFGAGNPIETIKHAGLKAINVKTRDLTINNPAPELRTIQNDEERIREIAKVFALKEENKRDNTLVLLGAKSQIKKANEAIRNELKNINKLSGIERQDSVLNPVYLSKTESGLAHKYQKNMVIRFYNKGSIHEDWSVESSNRDNNTLRLKLNNGSLTNSSNRRQTWNPKHKTGYKTFKKEILHISTGDRLIATAKMNSLGINNTDRFIVTEVNENHIWLSNRINKKNITKTVKISLKDLQNSHFNYDYATTLSKYSQKKTEHVIADFKAYALDKPTLNELTLRAKKTLTIFTNDAKTVQNRFGFTPTKLTATNVVLAASNIDRLINDKTISEIKNDIELSISVLSKNSSDSNNNNKDDKNDFATKAAKKAVHFAIEKVTSHAAGFTHKKLVAEALTYALNDQLALLGKEVTHAKIMKAIDEKRKSGELIMGRYFEDGTRWTTKEMLACEHSIVESLKGGKDKLKPLLNDEVVNKAIENTKLTPGQKDACHLITTTKDQFVMIQGYAGTGKTTMFAEVQNMLRNMVNDKNQAPQIQSQGQNKQNQNIEMLALAPTHRAVKELKDIGIEAQTLKSFLIEQKTEQKNIGTSIKINNKLIILDEASMVSNNDFNQFLALVKDSQAHVVLSGDIAQHIAIESGKPFEMAQKLGILKAVFLQEIVRQRNPILKGAVENIIQGDYQSAFKKIANENPQNHIERLKNTEEINETKEAKKAKEDRFFDTLKSSIVEIDNNKLNPNKENEKSEKTLEQRIAEDYLSRVPEIRDQTVVIVHANRDRKTITDIIRNGLKDRGEIDKKGLEVSCIIPKGLTNAEYKSLSSYSIGDVIKLGKEYYHVAMIEPVIKSILLKDESGNTRYFYPEKQAGKFNTELYGHIKAELAAGDTIRLTKTDKERERYANFEYKIETITNNSVILKSKDDKDKQKNKQLILKYQELKDAHWDYAQTVTGYGIQGGSKTYVIDFEVSYRKNLANQRSFYIGASRAIQHLTIYTDNKEKLLNRIVANKGDKYSALEVVGDIDSSKINESNSNKNKDKSAKTTEIIAGTQSAISQINNQRTIKNNNFTNYGYGSGKVGHESYDTKDIVEIEKSVKALAEVFVEKILGKPNPKLSTTTEWRYGNKGSLAIKMSGDKKGLWHNFETGESGNLISLLKKETGLPFKETLKYTTNMSGIILPTAKKGQKKQLDKIVVDEKINTKTKDYAVTLAKESLPIGGTIVERYLREIRGIKNVDSNDIRYHPKVYTGKGETQKYLPAMLAICRDKNENIQCVQATYLDPKTANKADLTVKKRTYASPSETTVVLQKSNDEDNDKSKTSYIAEGVETGLSIKDAIKHGDVFVTLGKSNFTTLDPTKLGQRVMFCLDNDGKNIYSDKIIYKAAQRLINSGKDLFISVPNQINNQKTDFNDIARINGIKSVEHYLLNNIKSYDKLDKKIDLLQDDFGKKYTQNIKNDMQPTQRQDYDLQKTNKHGIDIIDKSHSAPNFKQKDISLNSNKRDFEREI